MSNTVAIKNLLGSVNQVVKYYDKTFETTGQAFSIIHACDLLSNEVVLHTRFIGYLLNPKAGHKQKDKFLKLFFKTLKIDQSTEGFQIELEKSIGRKNLEVTDGGRIDIFISNNAKKIAYAIEIKIFALEQEKQLERYFNFIKNNNYNLKKSCVYYLTLTGEDSENGGGTPYKKLSFCDDIIKWIEECRIASIDQPIVRETLSQYSNAIKTLTNQNIDKHMSEDIINIITGSEETFNAFEAMTNLKGNIYQNLIENLVNVLKEIPYIKNQYDITASEKFFQKKESIIQFSHRESKMPRLLLIWENYSFLGFGLHGDGKTIEPSIQDKLAITLNNLNLFGECLTKKGKYNNWYWLTIVNELQGQPKLNFESWELFKSKELAEKIAEWIKEIYQAYQKVKTNEFTVNNIGDLGNQDSF